MWDERMYVDNWLQFGALVAFEIACPQAHMVHHQSVVCPWGYVPCKV
jgi:hypothetical protein